MLKRSGSMSESSCKQKIGTLIFELLKESIILVNSVNFGARRWTFIPKMRLELEFLNLLIKAFSCNKSQRWLFEFKPKIALKKGFKRRLCVLLSSTLTRSKLAITKLRQNDTKKGGGEGRTGTEALRVAGSSKNKQS